MSPALDEMHGTVTLSLGYGIEFYWSIQEHCIATTVI